MSKQWDRGRHLANAVVTYRWSLDPAPTDTAFGAMRRRRQLRPLKQIAVAIGWTAFALYLIGVLLP